MQRRKFLKAFATSGLGFALLTAAGPLAVSGLLAQSYPSRPITVIFPLAGGSPQETIMRAMAIVASKELGQPVVVEPKPGAAVAPTIIAQTAKSDGYVISGVFSTIAVVPQIEKVGFDPARDFTYLMQFASFPIGIAIKADSPHKTWVDVLAHAKSNPQSDVRHTGRRFIRAARHGTRAG